MTTQFATIANQEKPQIAAPVFAARTDFSTVIPSSTAQALLKEVRLLCGIGQSRLASDRLLAFVDRCIREADRDALTELTRDLTLTLGQDDQTFDTDRGQALIINVLAMTSRVQDVAAERSALHASFFAFLEKAKTRAYAEALLANL